MAGELDKIKEVFSDPKDKKKMWLYIGIGVVGLVLTYLIYKHLSGSSSSGGTTVSPASGAAAGSSSQPGYGPGYLTGQNYSQIQSQLAGIQSSLSSSQLSSAAPGSTTGSSAPASAIMGGQPFHTAASVPTIAPSAGNMPAQQVSAVPYDQTPYSMNTPVSASVSATPQYTQTMSNLSSAGYAPSQASAVATNAANFQLLSQAQKTYANLIASGSTPAQALSISGPIN